MTAPSVATRWLQSESWHRKALFATAFALAATHVIGILSTSGPRGAMVKGDARAYFAYLPSIVLDHDLDLRNQFAVLRPEGATEYPFGVGRGGRAANPFPVAPAFMWLPGYVAGVGFDVGAGSAAAGGQPLGYGAGAALGSAVWSILLVGFGADITRRLLRRSVGAAEAFAATLMAWLATPALYYTVISPLYSHAPAWVAISLMLWLTWRAAHDPSRVDLWFWSGLAAGWVVAVRLQDVPLLAVPVILLAVGAPHMPSARAALQPVAAWLCALLVGYLAQGFTSYWLHGTVVPFGGAVPLSKPTLSNLAGILFSLGYRGWISWTPIVLPALVGLGLLGSRGPSSTTRWFALAAAAGIVGMIVIDLTHPFGAGAAYGGRRYVSATPLVALGLAALLSHLVGTRPRAIAWVALPALTIWNLWLLVSYELLVIRHGLYPTLVQAARYAVGFGVS